MKYIDDLSMPILEILLGNDECYIGINCFVSDEDEEIYYELLNYLDEKFIIKYEDFKKIEIGDEFLDTCSEVVKKITSDEVEEYEPFIIRELYQEELQLRKRRNAKQWQK